MRTLPLTNEEISAWLRLVSTQGIGPATAHALLAAFGLPERIFEQPLAALTHAVGPAIAHALQRPPADDFYQQVEQTIAWVARPGNYLVTFSDPAYPGGLLNLTHPPPLLYIKGQLEWLHTPSIAIVGSRNASAQGLVNAEQFAHLLADAGLTVVSGLALGIDSAAHRGALSGRSGTIAVMGTGADLIYPACHRQLAHKIVAYGAIVSEWPLGTPARAQHFPRRNQLIAGLAQGVLVVEAAARSGSLITARLANELGREVFAMPGSIHSPLVKGCHQLIKEGAKLIESVQDVLDELRIHPIQTKSKSESTATALNHVCAPRAKCIESHPKRPPARPRPTASTEVAMKAVKATIDIDIDSLDTNARGVLAALGHHPNSTALELLSARTGLTSAALQATLLQLELSGWITALPGGRVVLIRSVD